VALRAVTRHLHGRAYLREEVAGTSFLVAPTSFFQTNVRAAATLVQHVVQAIARAGAHRVLDLYAGRGSSRCRSRAVGAR